MRVWTKQRPADGVWWLAVHPERRGSIWPGEAWPLKAEFRGELLYINGVAFAGNKELDETLLGALWMPLTPDDPFEASDKAQDPPHDPLDPCRCEAAELATSLMAMVILNSGRPPEQQTPFLNRFGPMASRMLCLADKVKMLRLMYDEAQQDAKSCRAQLVELRAPPSETELAAIDQRIASQDSDTRYQADQDRACLMRALKEARSRATWFEQDSEEARKILRQRIADLEAIKKRLFLTENTFCVPNHGAEQCDCESDLAPKIMQGLGSDAAKAHESSSVIDLGDFLAGQVLCLRVKINGLRATKEAAEKDAVATTALLKSVQQDMHDMAQGKLRFAGKAELEETLRDAVVQRDEFRIRLEASQEIVDNPWISTGIEG